jgi:hypothetical protein
MPVRFRHDQQSDVSWMVLTLKKTSKMKAQLLIHFSICLLFFTGITFFSASAQKKKVSFNNSTIVPGAEGTVKVKKDKNGNYNIDIEIVNLADSKKLTPSRKVYVVWMETHEKGVKNIGQVHSSSSMLSKTKKASITTVSPFKPIRIFITAEDDGGTEEPGDVVVLTTDTFN